MVDRQIITLAVHQRSGAGGMAEGTILRYAEQLLCLCFRKRLDDKQKDKSRCLYDIFSIFTD